MALFLNQFPEDQTALLEAVLEALLEDPQATAALSIALTASAYLSWSDDAERSYQEAFELAQRVVALDPHYPNAHFALALICMWTSRTEQAAAEFQESIKLNPSFAAAHAVLGAVLNFLGDPESVGNQTMSKKSPGGVVEDEEVFRIFPKVTHQVGVIQDQVEIVSGRLKMSLFQGLHHSSHSSSDVVGVKREDLVELCRREFQGTRLADGLGQNRARV